MSEFYQLLSHLDTFTSELTVCGWEMESMKEAVCSHPLPSSPAIFQCFIHKVLVTQLCPTLRPGGLWPARGILQARVLVCIAVCFSNNEVMVRICELCLCLFHHLSAVFRLHPWAVAPLQPPCSNMPKD